MGNYLQMADVKKIEALLELGWSQRRIAREVGCRRETVARYQRLRGENRPNPIAGSVDLEEAKPDRRLGDRIGHLGPGLDREPAPPSTRLAAAGRVASDRRSVSFSVGRGAEIGGAGARTLAGRRGPGLGGVALYYLQAPRPGTSPARPSRASGSSSIASPRSSR